MKFSEFDKLVAASQSGKKIIIECESGSTFTFDAGHSFSIADVLSWKSWREAKPIEKTAYVIGELMNCGELFSIDLNMYKSLDELMHYNPNCVTPVKLTWEVYE